MKPSVAIYLQHYLSPSMTFIYRQLLGIKDGFHSIVLCSDKLENTNLFPFGKIFYKKRNFLSIKKSKVATKIYGARKLLSLQPVISKSQRKYFKSKLIENKVKLIHAHFGPSGLEILPIAKELNIPLVCTFHGYDGSILLNFKDYRKKLENLFNYAHIIIPSNYMLQELKEKIKPLTNYSVIHYGIPLDKFKFTTRPPIIRKFKEAKKITFLQVSNFVEKKGHFYTISAFSDFLKIYKNAELVLGGDGYLKDEIQNLVNKFGISNKVIFKGRVNHQQVTELMENADVFLHHSVTSKAGDKEGIPNVIMEAMATGLPSISTVHAGIPELIKDEINGFLVAERNIGKYTQKIIKLVSTPLNFSYEARKTIESDFNLNLQNEKLIRIYNSLLN